MKHCPHCKSEILNDSIYCDRCGQHLMICSDCGTFARGKFCPNCGGKNIIDPLEYEQMQQTQSVAHAASVAAAPVAMQPIQLISADGSIVLKIDDATQQYMIGRKSPQFAYDLLSCSRMSREHATICWNQTAGVWQVTDVGSTHGTFVNDQRITPHVACTISNGDKVTFANYEFNIKV